MKNQVFYKRFQFAFAGILTTFKYESSFRWQILMGLSAFVLLAFFRADAVWWGLISLSIGGVLSTELINTAMENLIDKLHPELHPSIKIVKDCLAGAVLIFSIATLGVLFSFLWQLSNSIL